MRTITHHLLVFFLIFPAKAYFSGTWSIGPFCRKLGVSSPVHRNTKWKKHSALSSSMNNNAIDKITISMEKPMGIVIEEIDVEHTTGGVRIASANPEGNAARAMSSSRACVHDIILAINGVSCQGKSFDQIMDEIRESEASVISLTLGRDSKKCAVISFPNGIHVAATPGEYLGNIAQTASYTLPYKCRAGGCGTCEQSVLVDGKGPRLMRPCVTQVPSECKTIQILK